MTAIGRQHSWTLLEVASRQPPPTSKVRDRRAITIEGLPSTRNNIGLDRAGADPPGSCLGQSSTRTQALVEHPIILLHDLDSAFGPAGPVPPRHPVQHREDTSRAYRNIVDDEAAC